MCDAVQSFLKKGRLLKEWNTTVITLVPKRKHVSRISDFRPISCCGVLYKCISKILAERMKPHLEKLVSLNQSAFIKGPKISDSILVARELLRNYNRNDTSRRRCAIKIDIN